MRALLKINKRNILYIIGTKQAGRRAGPDGKAKRGRTGKRSGELIGSLSQSFFPKRVFMKTGMGKVTRIVFVSKGRGKFSTKSGLPITFPYALPKIKTQFLTIEIILPKKAFSVRLN